MKHWRPDPTDAVPLEEQSIRRRKRDWTNVDSYAPPRARPQHRGEEHVGGWIGLVLIGALCAVIAIGAATVLAGPSPIDQLAIDP